MTRVVNIHHNVPYDFYIGRKGHGEDGYYGNYCSGKNREEKIDNFRKYFYNRIENDSEFERRVELMRDKVLGCFCFPQHCHGDVYVEYFENNPPPSVDDLLSSLG